MFSDAAFHHLGLACRRIEIECDALTALGYAAEGPAIEDPVQKVRVQFFTGAGPRVELIEPTAPDSPVQGILKRGIKLYHLAYEVADFGIAVSECERGGYRQLAPSAPAAAFGMRRIIFMMSNTFMIIELIEAPPG